MKRLLSFLHSMKFGLALLILVMVCSLAGSLIPQGRAAAWYTQYYPAAGALILKLGLDGLFGRWYFILLLGLLCINLVFCAITRFANVHGMKKRALRAAAGLRTENLIGEEASCSLAAYLSGRRYRLYTAEDAAVFYKNMAGYYGSFFVHLSLLLILVLGALVLGLSDVTDHDLMPGETLVLADGTKLELDSFRMTDEKGRPDYTSVIRVTAPDETQSGLREISVNYPFTFRSFKYYQHSYGEAGSITAVNTKTGGADVFYLTEQSFLSGDGQNGIWFDVLYPNSAYQVLVSEGGKITPMMALPGDAVQTGDISFEFNEPVNYPGIRVKRIPNPFPPLLYASFVLMTAGFWLCFFHEPALVTLRGGSYAIAPSKTQAAQFEIDAFLYKYKENRT